MPENGNETALATATLAERVLIKGDLQPLTPQQRAEYYMRVCESLGMNPLTKPFSYLQLSGKLVLYANKDATEQLRNLHNISARIVDRQRLDDLYIVTVEVSRPDGRVDSDIGVVNVNGLKGDALANALMKAVTKAKRRATLSVCGLGMLDETEIETIPNATRIDEPQIESEPPSPHPPKSASVKGKSHPPPQPTTQHWSSNPKAWQGFIDTIRKIVGEMTEYEILLALSMDAGVAIDESSKWSGTKEEACGAVIASFCGYDATGILVLDLTVLGKLRQPAINYAVALCERVARDIEEYSEQLMSDENEDEDEDNGINIQIQPAWWNKLIGNWQIMGYRDPKHAADTARTLLSYSQLTMDMTFEQAYEVLNNQL